MGKIKAEWNKIRGMSRSDALWYIWEYYKYYLMGLAIILFVIVLVIQANVANRIETVLSVDLVDVGVEQLAADDFADAYAEQLSLDPKQQKVSATVSTVEGGKVAELQKLIMRVAAGEDDVLLCDTDITDYLLKGGGLSDLEAVLPEALLSRCQGKLLYVDADALSAWTEANRAGNAEQVILLSSDPSGMSKPVAVGDDVTSGCVSVFDRPAEFGTAVFSVAVTTKHQEAASAFLAWLLDQGGKEE